MGEHPEGAPMPTLPTSANPWGASGRTRRHSATDKEALAAFGGIEVVEFLRGAEEVAERQAEQQFKLNERREDRESAAALRSMRVEEQRVATELEQARSPAKLKALDILEHLYTANP
ncbi:hypothetical protein I4F81_000758 [Pyropia yezoensis]|uniref:Uncharacterized protein n=1 Tax=Pyropia yezoensis TaxID=2788 RepID=A0ACC3BK82_PYRYE|nr:hypothetical protein I4F81_000758 [Neopyropia yezoensis]